MGGSWTPYARLRDKGWVVLNSLEITRDPWSYQHFIEQSKAEFSVAKHGYVMTQCGWFSERSAAYLASGRPVLVQDTGFTNWLETGSGVISFHTLKAALAGMEEINSRYKFHCQAARAIAQEYFDSYKVLSHLVQCAMNPSCTPAKILAETSLSCSEVPRPIE